MMETTIWEYLKPFIDWLVYYGGMFLQYIVMIISNPIILGLIILYFVARFTRWYLKWEKKRREDEYLSKPSYEELARRNSELQEQIRLLRRKLRNTAFRDKKR